jgi:hypothetical protein
MGASCWSYFVPYQDDIEEALQALRDKVFRAGDYYRPDRNPFAQENLALAKKQLAEGRITQDEFDGLREEMELEGEHEPQTMEELLELCAEDMTHSIIDIECVSEDSDDLFTVSPLSLEEQHALWGTAQPTRELLKGVESRRWELRGRGYGVFAIAYKDGKPDEICFAGVTGD